MPRHQRRQRLVALGVQVALPRYRPNVRDLDLPHALALPKSAMLRLAGGAETA
jgi:hypothetical protein